MFHGQSVGVGIKVGDLVKVKWTTFANHRRAKKLGWTGASFGLVVDKLGTVVKVMFSDRPAKAITFVEAHLEVVNEGR